MATKYLVLKQTPAISTRETAKESVTELGDGSWLIVDDVEAVSGSAAVRAHLNGAEEGGTFVAVPARSWQPVTVKVETALRFS